MRAKPYHKAQNDLDAVHVAILIFIEEYCHNQGRSPSLREIGEAIGSTSSSYLWHQIQQLVRWGYLGRTLSARRFLFLLKQGYEAIGKQPKDNLNASLDQLKDENKRLRAWCELLHQERDDLRDQLHAHLTHVQ